MTKSEFDLSGRVLWVTGAGRGLGRSIAIALAHAGATVAATSRTSSDLELLADELQADGFDLHAYPASIADARAIRETSGLVVERHGGLDGLVNCAGISPSFTKSEDLDEETWANVLGVNLTGTFLCCRAAGAVMLEQGHGSIVNVSSIHARAGFPRIAAYAASKGGVEALTRTLAVEWAEHGVRVNTVAPGYFATDLSRPLLESRWGDRVDKSIPMGRTGDPQELTGAVVFLMSQASTYVTGSTLTVDGGWTA